MDYYAYLWEMGCGKSKIIIDTACHNYKTGKIDAILVIAPNAVHPNWAYEEIPKHCWDEVNPRCLIWDSKKKATKGMEYDMDNIINHDGLAILTMNYEALVLRKKRDKKKDKFHGLTRAKRFLKERNVLVVCDESHRIKTPSAGATKAVLSLSKLAKMRRICTGTVFSNSVFDLYTQFNFLDPSILGFNNYYTFKNSFGIFKRQYATHGAYDQLIGFKDIDRLSKLIEPHSDRMLKTDITEIDWPEKIYTKRFIKMSPALKKAYTQMKKEMYVELSCGTEVEATIALTMLLKLQQIVSGFVTYEDSDDVRWLEKDNTRAKALMDILEDIEGKVIIWAKFRPDIEAITSALDKRKANYVTYTGSTSQDERREAIVAFQDDPECTYFVANPDAAGEGLTLHAATTVVYYNNSFKYAKRLQSEDRAHRIGQRNDVNIIDLVMEDTIDSYIIDALLNKLDLASQVNGDKLKKWIS